MLYVFYGTDTEAVRTAAHQKIHHLKEVEPELSVGLLEAQEYEAGQFLTLASTVALFGGAQAYFVDMPSEQALCREEFYRDAKVLADSAHHFVVVEGALLSAEKKLLTAEARVVEEFKSAPTERVDTFALCDSLARKDKRTLWMQLQEVTAARVSTEEIIGVLWWQLKMLRLAQQTKSAAQAGVKEFPYNKAKKALANFKSGEIESLAHSLLELYHDGHAGKRDIDLALEEWVLRM